MKLFTKFIENVAIRTGVPIGGVWLILLTVGGAIYLIYEYPFYTQQDLIIGFVMWAVAYCALWLGYRSEFWMNTALLEVLRKHERGELDDTGD